MPKVVSYQIADSIDIRQFRQAFTAPLSHADSDELFYEVAENKCIYVFRYGVVSLLNHDDVEATAFLKIIHEYCRNPLPARLSDEFEIELGGDRIVFGYNKISIPDDGTEMLRLIMLHVSQSVALDHFEAQTNRLLEETNFHTQVLEQKGKLDLGGTALKKYIGKTLNLKNRITEHLYIFDSPEETWENEELGRLDTGLKKTFDLQARFRTIEEGLAIVKENLELFRDLLQHRQSNFLEWIIILLILVEVVNLFVEKIWG
ncbi:MAG: RMD1 family protein [Chitinophagaceae bacterium]|nr:RMD1 family protein [Chitinophagaceae bacterium]